MKQLIVILMLFLCYTPGKSQKFLAIDIYRPFGMKRLRYYSNEVLYYKLKEIRNVQKNTIADFYADSILFTNGDHIALNEIKVILTSRSNTTTKFLYKLPMQAATVLLCVDAINHMIYSEPGIGGLVDVRIAKVAAGMFATGLVIKIFTSRRVRPGKNKILKIMDLTL